MNSTLFRTFKIMGKRFYGYLATIILMTFFTSFLSIVSANLLNSLFDVIASGDFSGVSNTIGFNFVIGIISILIWRYFTISYNRHAKYQTMKVQKGVYEKSISLPMEYYDVNSSGSFLTKLVFTIEKACDIYGSRFRRVLNPIISSVIYLVPMFLLNEKITVILLVVNIFTLVINIFFNSPIIRVSKELIWLKAKETEQFLDTINGMGEIKTYFLENIFNEKLRGRFLDFKNKQRSRNIIVSSLNAVNTFSDLLCSVIFLVIGSLLLANGQIDVGELTAIYVLYVPFNVNFLQIGRYIPELSECLVYMQDIFDFLDEESEEGIFEECKSECLDLSKENVLEMKDVTFGYKDSKKTFNDFNLKLKNKEITVVTGKSGCGKSTLFKVFLGLYEIDKGDIKLFGENVTNIGFNTIRENVSYVSQNTYLYNVSILENIMYGRKGATKEEVIEACKKADAHEFIMKLEKGYDTIVEERGKNFSGGQKQKLSIARAFLKDAPILLLDESTSALDNVSENIFQDNIKKMAEEKTIIMIAHKPETIAMATVEECIG